MRNAYFTYYSDSSYKLLLQLYMELYGRKKVLAIHFGLDCLQMSHDCLKDKQRKAILKVLEENQCFISLPIGYHKSLIFQV